MKYATGNRYSKKKWYKHQLEEKTKETKKEVKHVSDRKNSIQTKEAKQ